MNQSLNRATVLNGPVRSTSRTVMATDVGLRFPDAVSFTSWEQLGHRITRVADCSAWCLGDWLVYGQHKYTERYRRVALAVSLDYQTLRNYAWVARRFDLKRRRTLLSLQHHAEVASMPPEEQDHWLDRAEAGRWSRNELRRRIRAERAPAAPVAAPPVPAALPRLEVSADRLDRWRSAARRAESGFEEWIVATLDAGAARTI